MRFLFLLITIVTISNSAMSQTWDWAKSISSKETVTPWSVVTDNKGSIYVAGRFKDTAYFGSKFVIADLYNSFYHDAFVAKYTTQGQIVWIKSFGANRDDNVIDMTADTAGNIYLACYTNSTREIKFDNFSYTGTGGDKAFILKLNPNGDLIWGRAVTSGSSSAVGISIDVNKSGQLALVGSYNYLDLVIDTTTLGHNHSTEAFMAMFSAHDGSLKWAKSATGRDYQSAWGVAIDDDGNVYTGGVYHNSVGFTHTDSLRGGQRTFLSKHDSTGQVKWLNAYYGRYSNSFEGLELSASNDLYIAGWHDRDSVTLNDTAYKVTSSCFYIQKLNVSGKSYWTRSTPTSGLGRIQGIATDSSNNLYLAGFFNGRLIFERDTLVAPVYKEYKNFIVKMNPSGSCIVASSGGYNIDDEGVDYLEADHLGNAYIVGSFGNSVNDSAYYGNNLLVSKGNYDGHIAKYNTTSVCEVRTSFKTSTNNACKGSTVKLTNTTTRALSYSWLVNGVLYSTAKDTTFVPTQTGNYTIKLTATNNSCDDSATSTINVTTTYYDTINYTICEGDSIFLVGEYRDSAGTWYDSLKALSGCDSIIKYNVAINPVYLKNIDLKFCNGDSLLIGGKYYKNSGTYYDSLKTVAGCDSVLKSTITRNNKIFTNNSKTICSGDSLFFRGEFYKNSGTYYDTLKNIDGCDSIVILVLTVNTLPIVSFTGLDTAYFINDNTASLNGSPLGGVFSGAGIIGNEFTPSFAGVGIHTIVYSYTDANSCENSHSKQTRVKLNISTKEIEQFEVHIYPNPSSGVFNLEVDGEKPNIEIIDMVGRIVYSAESRKKEFYLDLWHLPVGVYQIKITVGHKVVIERISINK